MKSEFKFSCCQFYLEHYKKRQRKIFAWMEVADFGIKYIVCSQYDMIPESKIWRSWDIDQAAGLLYML